MSHTTSDARKRRDGTVVAHQPGWSKEPHPGAKEDCDRCAFVSPDPPTVPRLARSVDDLRVGMVVAMECLAGFPNSHWKVGTLAIHDGVIGFSVDDGGWLYPHYRGMRLAHQGQVVILADAPDPPARDWLVPATQMEALRESVREHDADGGLWNWILIHARAVLDAAREVEHE